MRILYLTHRLPYAPNRGDRIRAYHMLRHLATRHEVDLVSLVHDDEEEAHRVDVRRTVASVTTARVRKVRNLFRAGAAVLTREPLTHALLNAPQLHERLEAIVGARAPDLVLAYCSGMAQLALAPPLQGIPFVLDMVDVDSEKWASLGRTGSTPKYWIYRREAATLSVFERTAATMARATLVVNERERKSLVQIGVAGRIEVVPNGVELVGFKSPLPPADEPRVVFCGVMNYEPNEAAAVWLARDVWPHVRRARPDARLVLLGANPTRRVQSLGNVDPSVEVTGSVADVRANLWRSAVSVAPLTVARGLQNKVLEATAAGLPSIVTRAVLDGLPEEVVPACRRADTAKEFVRHILDLLAYSPVARRSIAERATLEPLDWAHRLAPLDSILLNAAADLRRRTA